MIKGGERMGLQRDAALVCVLSKFDRSDLSSGVRAQGQVGREGSCGPPPEEAAHFLSLFPAQVLI